MSAFTTSHAQNKIDSLLMDNHQPPLTWTSDQALPLKDSIRDMIRLQQACQIPDELFWEIFNARVLLNQPIDLTLFFNTRDNSFGQA